MTLRLVHSAPEFFSFSGRAPVKRGEAFGCICARCEREISAPFGFDGMLVWCLYCGMDAGFVPMIEQPFSHEYLFGITRQECLADHAALARGDDFDDHCLARARRLNRVVDL